MTALFHHCLVQAARNQLFDYFNILKPRVNHWVIVDEVLVNTRENLALVARYERRRRELVAQELEEIYGAQGPFEVAKLSRWQGRAVCDALADANEHNQDHPGTPPHILLLHQYFKPDHEQGGEPPTSYQSNFWTFAGGFLRPRNYRKNVGHFEHHILPWFQATYPHLKVIGSEYAADGRIGRTGDARLESLGWRAHPDWGWDYDAMQDRSDRYLQVLRNLVIHNYQYRYRKVIKGYCLFGLGRGPANTEFWSYRLDPARSPVEEAKDLDDATADQLRARVDTMHSCLEAHSHHGPALLCGARSQKRLPPPVNVGNISQEESTSEKPVSPGSQQVPEVYGCGPEGTSYCQEPITSGLIPQ